MLVSTIISRRQLTRSCLSWISPVLGKGNQMSHTTHFQWVLHADPTLFKLYHGDSTHTLVFPGFHQHWARAIECHTQHFQWVLYADRNIISVISRPQLTCSCEFLVNFASTRQGLSNVTHNTCWGPTSHIVTFNSDSSKILSVGKELKRIYPLE